MVRGRNPRRNRRVRPLAFPHPTLLPTASEYFRGFTILPLLYYASNLHFHVYIGRHQTCENGIERLFKHGSIATSRWVFFIPFIKCQHLWTRVSIMKWSRKVGDILVIQKFLKFKTILSLFPSNSHSSYSIFTKNYKK